METEICVAADATLLNKAFIQKVGRAFVAAGRSRLGMAKWLTNQIADHLGCGGIVVDTKGRLLHFPEDIVEKSFAGGEWFSWNTDVKKFAERAPMRNPKRTLLRRLRLIDVAFKVAGQPLT